MVVFAKQDTDNTRLVSIPVYLLQQFNLINVGCSSVTLVPFLCLTCFVLCLRSKTALYRFRLCDHFSWDPVVTWCGESFTLVIGVLILQLDCGVA